jgi:hypothetical protein
MAAGESVLIPISPDDTLDAIAAQIRGAGAPQVQLLVPDDTAALRYSRWAAFSACSSRSSRIMSICC